MFNCFYVCHQTEWPVTPNVMVKERFSAVFLYIYRIHFSFWKLIYTIITPNVINAFYAYSIKYKDWRIKAAIQIYIYIYIYRERKINRKKNEKTPPPSNIVYNCCCFIWLFLFIQATAYNVEKNTAETIAQISSPFSSCIWLFVYYKLYIYIYT